MLGISIFKPYLIHTYPQVHTRLDGGLYDESRADVRADAAVFRPVARPHHCGASQGYKMKLIVVFSVFPLNFSSVQLIYIYICIHFVTRFLSGLWSISWRTDSLSPNNRKDNQLFKFRKSHGTQYTSLEG